MWTGLLYFGDCCRLVRRPRTLLAQMLNLGCAYYLAGMLWKGFMVSTNCESPVFIVQSGGDLRLHRGDIFFLTGSDSFRAGDEVVYQVPGREISIAHRVANVHEKPDGTLALLTKGDDNGVDDRGLYLQGQLFLTRPEIVGLVVAYLPYLGILVLMLNDYLCLKCWLFLSTAFACLIGRGSWKSFVVLSLADCVSFSARVTALFTEALVADTVFEAEGKFDLAGHLDPVIGGFGSMVWCSPRKGVQWFGNAAKYPLFQDNIMAGSLCTWLVFRSVKQRDGEAMVKLWVSKAICEAESEWQLALHALEQIVRHGVVRQLDARMLGAARAACLKAGQWELALQLSRQRRDTGAKPDAFHFSVEMLALERQGRLDLALRLFEEMASQSVPPNQYVYSALMGDGSDPTAWPRALALLEALRNCATAEEWEVAIDLLERMRASMKVTAPALASTIASCRGGQWDADLWNSVIYSCAIAGRARDAKALLSAMKARKLEPTVECYNSCLVAVSQSSSSSTDAKRWLTKMQKDRVDPNTVTLNAGIGMFASAGSWEEALAFAGGLRQTEILPSQVTYGALIGTCKASRSWPAALALLEVTAFNIAISVCESCDQPPAFLDSLRVRVFSPLAKLGPLRAPRGGCYNTVLAACQNAGEWYLALQLFQEIEASPQLTPDVYTYSSVISACDVGEQWEWAVNLFRRMEAQGIAASDVIFNSLVSVCKKCGQQEWVDYLLAEMERRGLEKGYITLSGVSAQLRLWKVFMGKLEGASHLFAEALRDGAFAPWVREGRLLDLHGMSTEVAKVAVYMALRGIPDLPEDDLAFTWGLKIIVGKGLHSANGEVVLDPAVRELLEQVFRLKVSSTKAGSYRVLPEDLWNIRLQGSWPPAWLTEGKEPPKALHWKGERKLAARRRQKKRKALVGATAKAVRREKGAYVLPSPTGAQVDKDAAKLGILT
ncbi:Signal peptidase complex catalytic subunit SEC11A [Symbiodinium microadriaticum]|uniref:Signal peptidase complex catalytic subunit SEC11A n=1 Tax=Symbiodinium microadriaticum TaxID=2951 RepID=A0A1Q9CRK0_SYMMI|nr:Signal peptidase complex catalytic subunit SEC11A [Symbiodinium microadriaticum]